MMIRLRTTQRTVLALVVMLLSVLTTFTSCDVHEFPAVPATRPVYVHVITGNMTMEMWEQNQTATRSISSGSADLTEGTVRYVLRAYPILNGKTMMDYTHEFVFKRNLVNGLDNEFVVALPAGDYTVMTWADLTADTTYYYDCTNFAEITLQGKHVGTTDYRDAFRGRADIHIVEDYIERAPDTVHVTLERPLAKYEFITSDVKEFIDKELRRLNQEDESANTGTGQRQVNLDDYYVVFNYSGYMPNTYSLFTDKPVNSATGICFESKLTQLSADEASMGFDYVFVDDSDEQAVNVQVQLVDAQHVVRASSDIIRVTMRRNYHTIVRGSFLTKRVEGGVVINPDFNGDINVVLP